MRLVCKSAVLCLVIALFTTGCVVQYDTSRPKITNEGAIIMDVGEIQVYDNYQGDDMSLLDPPARDLAAQWFRRKLEANRMNDRRLVVDISRAETRKNATSTSPKFASYSTEMEIALKVYEPGQHLATSHANISLKVTREVKRDANIKERDAFFAGMARDVVRKMDEIFPKQIKNHLNTYVINMPVQTTGQDY